jgi:hypothetical protein
MFIHHHPDVHQLLPVQPMSIETMKMALEALELALRSHGVMLLSDPPQDAWKSYGVEADARKAITALRLAIEQAEKQKPVAWANINKHGDITHTNNKRMPWSKTPLYITPPAQPAKQEPVAWFGLEPSDMPDGDNPMYDHDFFLKGMAWADAILRKKNTTPPAAQWVGLTEKDFAAINQSCLTKLQAAISAESILKEKNT